MAKQTCAICGAEINLLQQQKLSDGNYICRKLCSKRVMMDFDLMNSTLIDVQAHIKQLEEGTNIWNQLFRPLKKKSIKRPGGGYVAVAEELGLMAKLEPHYKFFIFGKYYLANVYRIADLYGYELEEGTKVVMGNAAAGKKSNTTQKTRSVHYYFWDTEGMSDFTVNLGTQSYTKVQKYYNSLFGIQKTLGNIKNTWKNQMNAIKAVGAAVKTVVSGEDASSEGAAAVAALDRMQYGDRTEWIAKAEAAMARYQR